MEYDSCNIFGHAGVLVVRTLVVECQGTRGSNAPRRTQRVAATSSGKKPDFPPGIASVLPPQLVGKHGNEIYQLLHASWFASDALPNVRQQSGAASLSEKSDDDAQHLEVLCGRTDILAKLALLGSRPASSCAVLALLARVGTPCLRLGVRSAALPADGWRAPALRLGRLHVSNVSPQARW